VLPPVKAADLEVDTCREVPFGALPDPLLGGCLRFDYYTALGCDNLPLSRLRRGLVKAGGFLLRNEFVGFPPGHACLNASE